LKLAWDKSATVSNCTSGVRKCGIYPYNPDVLADDVFEYEIVTSTEWYRLPYTLINCYVV
jgi:hypothetical protein